jgi:hypothetical protein
LLETVRDKIAIFIPDSDPTIIDLTLIFVKRRKRYAMRLRKGFVFPRLHRSQRVVPLPGSTAP